MLMLHLHGSCEQVGQIARMDLAVIQERDPAAMSPLLSLLYFKGYQGIQAHRIAHVLWRNGRKALALLLQSKSSQVGSLVSAPLRDRPRSALCAEQVLLSSLTGAAALVYW
jgi:hypothetical protein